MRGTLAALPAILALLAVPAPLAAKGDTVRITIKGGDLAAPIEITDREALARFNVWTSPDSKGEGLIVDFPRGIAKPPQGLPVYEVSFLTSRSGRNTYVVSYVIDPATGEGYVFLPGRNDPGYWGNVWLIARGNEGNWFHAWSAWETLAHPLIARARKRAPSRAPVAGNRPPAP